MRKKAGGAEVPDGNDIGECTPKSEIVPGTIKESEVKYCFPTVTKRSQKPSVVVKQSKTKSIPPPLRNRGKRKMQQWMWIILTCVVVIALFLLGNIGFFSNLSNFRPRSHSNPSARWITGVAGISKIADHEGGGGWLVVEVGSGEEIIQSSQNALV